MGSIQSPYQYAPKYLGEPRPLRVILVGAGISGIAAVKLFQETLATLPVSLILYDKNSDVGGTWLENRYPGCSCDIPAHGYTYSWEGNPNWSSVYVGSEEIFDYYKSKARDYGVFRYLKLRHRVISAAWDQSSDKWRVEVEDMDKQRIFVDDADVLINAGGFLNNWKWPNIPGIQSYTGTLIHSAKWDTDVQLTGKTVAVIGSGSSAIQIVPKLQKKVKHLTSFHRSPTWITNEFSQEDRLTEYSDEQRDTWKQNPAEFIKFRKAIETSSNKFFSSQIKGSQAQEEMLKRFTRDMSVVLDRKNLSSRIIPDFAVGCRRMTPGHGYLEALVADNVTVLSEPIEAFTPLGLRTLDKQEHHFDAIICATGFDTSFRPSFSLTGPDGRELRAEWKDEPRSYLSVAASGFPNYFMTTGPNFPLANGTVLPCIEQCIKFAIKALHKIQSENIRSLHPKKEAVDDFQEHKDAVMENMVWTSNCASWYKNGKADGKVWGPWPGSALHFMELLSEPRWEDFEIIRRSSNRFEYLGDGRSKTESTGGDLAWYVSENGTQPMEVA